jgi:hypothetical protein
MNGWTAEPKFGGTWLQLGFHSLRCIKLAKVSAPRFPAIHSRTRFDFGADVDNPVIYVSPLIFIREVERCPNDDPALQRNW